MAERIGNKVPHPFSALYLFDYRTHGDDGNFVGLWRQCEKPDRWYAGRGEKPAQKDYTTHLMLLKTLAVLLTWCDPALVLCAGLAERVGLLPALMG